MLEARAPPRAGPAMEVPLDKLVSGGRSTEEGAPRGQVEGHESASSLLPPGRVHGGDDELAELLLSMVPSQTSMLLIFTLPRSKTNKKSLCGNGDMRSETNRAARRTEKQSGKAHARAGSGPAPSQSWGAPGLPRALPRHLQPFKQPHQQARGEPRVRGTAKCTRGCKCTRRAGAHRRGANIGGCPAPAPIRPVAEFGAGKSYPHAGVM